MKADDAREYSESLGQIGSGWWRQIAWAYQQEIPEALGLSRREWAEKYHSYLRLPVDERREAEAELDAEGLGHREIAQVLGVSPSTVDRDLRPASDDAGDPEDPQVTPVQGGEPASSDAGSPDEADGEPDVIRTANGQSYPTGTDGEPDQDSPPSCPMENWPAKKRTLRGMLLTFEQNTTPEQSADLVPMLTKSLRAHERNAQKAS